MSLSSSTLSTITGLLKQKYLASDLIQNSMIDFGPLTAKLLSEGDTSCGGRNIPFPLIYASGGGIGTSMNAAFNNVAPTASVSFNLTRGCAFGQIVLGGEALAASENPDEAFIDDLSLEIENKKKRFKEYVSALVYGDGTAAMAQVGSISTATSGATQGVITLVDLPLAGRFNVNDVISVTIGSTVAASNSLTQWSLSGVLTATSAALATANTSTALGGGFAQTAYVVAVNVQAGTLQVSATQGGSAGTLAASGGLFYGSDASIAAGSFIFIAGDASLVASTPIVQAQPANSQGFGNACVAGLLAWAPIGGPSDTGSNSAQTGTFFGANRTGNSSLAGLVVDGTAAGLNLGTIRATLTNAVAQLRQVSSKPKRCYMHPIAFYKLSLELQSQGMYTGSRGEGPSGEGSFGFSSLVLPTDVGDITVISDPQCMPVLDSGANSAAYTVASGYSGAMTAFLLDDNWEVVSSKEIPFLDETDGTFLLRVQGQDQYQAQMKAYWQVGTHRPNGSAIALLPL